MSASQSAAPVGTLQNTEQPVAGAYTHHVIPPCTGGRGHNHQRRFGPSPYIGTRNSHHSQEATAPSLVVYRSANLNVAELEFQIGNFNSARVNVHLTPSELRELAGRLLDAAYDIEANPSSVLMSECEA